MRVYVHGGVAGIDRDELPSLAPAVRAAIEARRALDAVEDAVRVLEDEPALNAGWGAVLALGGELELDAGIVDGPSGRCGAVAGVTVRNPVSLARRVLEETPHVLLAGAGAMEFAGDAERLYGTTPEETRAWERARAEGRLDLRDFGRADQVETVGAVALDDEGRLAAASSTGGVRGKLRGRVGDSPLFGAGVYASQRAAAVGTGVGEVFIETLACFRVGSLIEEGAHPQQACEGVVELLGRRRATAAGVLALDAAGRAGAAFRGAALAVESRDGPFPANRMA